MVLKYQDVERRKSSKVEGCRDVKGDHGLREREYFDLRHSQDHIRQYVVDRTGRKVSLGVGNMMIQYIYDGVDRNENWRGVSH